MKIDYRNTLFGDEIRNVVFLDLPEGKDAK